MSDLYLSGETTDGTRLSLAPITSDKLARCADAPADTTGYFLLEEDPRDPFGTINILARIDDDEAAFRLGQMIQMS